MGTIGFLKSIFAGQNQFASGGLLLMVVGSIAAYLRSVPETLWDWFVEQTTMMITIKDDDAAFVWVKEWFLEQEFLKGLRRVDLDTTLRGNRRALVPAPGQHWFWYGGRPFRVTFYRSEDTRGWVPQRTETLYFRTIGRQQSFLKRFVDEIVTCHEKKLTVQSFLFTYDEYWDRMESYTPRLLESIILESGEKERLIRDVEKFKASRQRYRQLGVPYHRGYLLYGPPGTGKTSLVSALAARFAMSIYVLDLTNFNDRSLASAMNDVPPNSVILFEDIDCAKSGKARDKQEDPVRAQLAPGSKEKDAADLLGVTLSGLLNVLDGFRAPENVLFVMTSNKIEQLDPALLRPGRIDFRLYLGRASDRQKVGLYLRFFPKASEFEAEMFVEDHRSAETMAEFQGLLLALEEQHENQAPTLSEVLIR